MKSGKWTGEGYDQGEIGDREKESGGKGGKGERERGKKIGQSRGNVIFYFLA